MRRRLRLRRPGSATEGGGATTPTAAGAGRTIRSSRRDRHGRGPRGPLVPPGSPLATTRADHFDRLVLDTVEHIARRHTDRLSDVDFAVADVPGLEDWPHDWVPLARSWPATANRPARVVVYRRPIESRAEGREELEDLVHDVLVEEVAELLGVDPEDLDGPD